MNNGIKVFIGLLCLPLLVLGAKAMFDPTGMIDRLAVVPQSVHGLNTIRGDVGGLMVGSAILMIAGLLTKNTAFFLATAIIMITVLVGRFAGIAFDGFDAALVPVIVIELVITGVMILAHKILA